MGNRTIVITVVGFLNFASPMFFVIHKIASVYASIFIKVLPFAVLFVFEPITDVEFSLFVVILAFTLLHALVKVALVSLGV